MNGDSGRSMAMFPTPLVCPAVDLNSRRHSKPRGCLQSKPPVHANLPAGTDIRNKVSLSDVNQQPPPSRVLGSLLITHGASLQPLRRSLRRGRPRIARLLTRGIERRILAFGCALPPGLAFLPLPAPAHHRVTQRADAGDLDLDAVAVLQILG